MKEFVKKYFQAHSAELSDHDGHLQVTLTPELQEVFKQNELRLVFDVNDVDESSELVTHGSFVLNSIYQQLQPRGEKVVSQLEQRLKPTLSRLRRQIVVRNAAIASITPVIAHNQDLIFNFKISYVSDERNEEIRSVGIDRHGAAFDPEQYYFDKDRRPVLASRSRKEFRLPRSRIELLYKQCLKETAQAAKVQATQLQDEVLKRLHNSITRIKGYYESQISELNDSNPSYESRRLVLDREFRHKLTEEINNHRIRIILKLLSYQVIERTDSDVTISIRCPDGHVIEVFTSFDTFTGLLSLGNCMECGSKQEEIVVARGHTVGCPTCVFECAGCHEPVAELQRRALCHCCEKPVCPTCVLICTDCHKAVCPEDMLSCAVGRELTCRACAEPCGICGDSLCKDHAFHCAKTREPICHKHRIVCSACRSIFSPNLFQGSSGPVCPNCKASIRNPTL